MKKSRSIAGTCYESPVVNVLNVCPEGVLCTSGNEYGSGIDDLPEVDFEWLDN